MKHTSKYVARVVRWTTPGEVVFQASGERVEVPCEPWAADMLRSWMEFKSIDHATLECLQDQTPAQIAVASSHMARRWPTLRGVFHWVLQQTSATISRTSCEHAHIRAALDDFARARVLVSDQDVLQRCRERRRQERRNCIEVVALLPNLNWANDGYSTLRSLARRLQDDGRCVRILATADPSSGHGSEQAADFAKIARSHCQTGVLVSAKTRADYLRRFVREGVPPEEIRFAIGDSAEGASQGSQKNLFLLQSAGAMTLLGDPNHEIFAPAQGARHPNLVVDAGRPERICRVRSGLEKSPSLLLDGTLALHEQLLGKRLTGVIDAFSGGAGVDFCSVCSHMLEDILEDRGSVVLSTTGIVWDRAACCTADGLHRLRALSANGVRARDIISAIRGGGEYAEGEASFALSHSPQVAECSLALDARNLLPPFMPGAGDPDELVFTTILRICFPDAYFARVPRFARANRSRSDAPQFRSKVQRIPFSFGEFASACLQAAPALSCHCEPAARIRELGVMLEELASLGRSDFTHEAQFRILEQQLPMIDEIEGHATEIPDRHTRSFIAEWIAWRRKTCQLSAFMEARGTIQAELAPPNWQDRLLRLGRLLRWWPDIVSIAKSLREEVMPGGIPAV